MNTYRPTTLSLILFFLFMGNISHGKSFATSIFNQWKNATVEMMEAEVPGSSAWLFPPPFSGSISVRVAAGSDDAEERVSSGTVARGSNDLELARDGSTDQLVGMRFRSIAIPQGATITNAYIEFTAKATDSGNCDLTIYGQDDDDPTKFLNSSYDISSRPKTSASVAWSPGDWTTVDQTYNSADISSIIQEIIDRSGWASGNDMVIMIDGSTTNKRNARSYNGSSSNAPLLIVDYTTGGGSSCNCSGTTYTGGLLSASSGTYCISSNQTTSDVINLSGSAELIVESGVIWEQTGPLTIGNGATLTICSGAELIMNNAAGTYNGTVIIRDNGKLIHNEAGFSKSSTGSLELEDFAVFESCESAFSVAGTELITYTGDGDGDAFFISRNQALNAVNNTEVASTSSNVNWADIQPSSATDLTPGNASFCQDNFSPSNCPGFPSGLTSACGSSSGITFGGFDCNSGVLTNPDFESGTTGWNFSSNASITTDSEFGSQAAYAGSGVGGVSQNYPASEGDVFSLSVYAKKSASEVASIAIKFLDSGYNEVGITPYNEIENSTFQEYTVSAKAPAGTAYAQALGWKSSGTGNATFDGFCMEQWTLTPPSCSGSSCVILPNNGNYIWAMDDSGVDDNWREYDNGGLMLCDNGDGTLSLKGNIINGRDAPWGNLPAPPCGPQDGWYIDLLLSDMKVWSEYQGNYVVNPSCPDAYQDLDYWDMSGTFSGIGCNAGRTVTVGSAGYRLQIGRGGNSLGCGYGISTWFLCDENGNPFKSDIYAHIDSTCYYSVRPNPTTDCSNQIVNHEFDNGTNDWYLNLQNGNTATYTIDNSSQLSGANSAFVDISSISATNWHTQLAQYNLSIVSGKDYIVSFDAKVTANRNISVSLQRSNAPYTTYWWQDVAISTSSNNYSFNIQMDSTNSGYLGLYFMLGETTDDVWIDNVVFKEDCPETCDPDPLNEGACSNNLISNSTLEGGNFTASGTYAGTPVMALDSDYSTPDSFALDYGLWVDASNAGGSVDGSCKLVVIQPNSADPPSWGQCLFPQDRNTSANYWWTATAGQCYTMCAWFAPFNENDPTGSVECSIDIETTGGEASNIVIDDAGGGTAFYNTDFVGADYVLTNNVTPLDINGVPFTNPSTQTLDWSTLDWQYKCIEFHATQTTQIVTNFTLNGNQTNHLVVDNVMFGICCDTEICGNGIDDDGDGDIDFDDADCTCPTITTTQNQNINICEGDNFTFITNSDAPNPPFNYIEFYRFDTQQSNPYTSSDPKVWLDEYSNTNGSGSITTNNFPLNGNASETYYVYGCVKPDPQAPGNTCFPMVEYIVTVTGCTTNCKGDNLGFEDGINHWTVGGGASISNDAYVGNNSIYLASSGDYVRQDVTTGISPDKTYQLTFYAKATSNRDWFRDFIEIFDGSNNMIGEVRGWLSVTTNWEEYSVIFTTPNSMDYISMVFPKWSGSAGIYVDEVCLKELPDFRRPTICNGCEIIPTSAGGQSSFWIDDGTEWLSYDADNGTKICHNPDGSITVQGNMLNIDESTSASACGPTSGWFIEVTLTDKQTWSEFGGNYDDHGIINNGCPDNHTDWEYWDATGTITGIGCNSGEVYNILGNVPGYRVQVGESANRNSCVFGMAGWMDYDHNGTTRQLDIYFDLEESCYNSCAPLTGTTYVVGGGNGWIYEVDLSDGTSTRINSNEITWSSGDPGINSLAFDHENQRFYYVQNTSNSESAGWLLGRYDVATGTHTELGNLRTGSYTHNPTDRASHLSFCSGKLYYMDFNNDDVISISLDNGGNIIDQVIEAANIGGISPGNVGDMVFDPDNSGKAYFSGINNPHFFSYNVLENNSYTLIDNDLGGYMTAMAFDENGTLYAGTNSNSLLYTIDPTNGDRVNTGINITYQGSSLTVWDFAGNNCVCFNSEICDNGIDDDGDGLIDGNDPDCSNCPTQTVSSTINDGSDDAEESLSSGAVNLGSSDLELIYDGGTQQLVGLRFNNINVPQGASISSAVIEFETDETGASATDLTLWGQSTDNAATFTTSNGNISNRAKTTASVSWSSVPAWNTSDEKHLTPDLSNIIQEIVGRPGWSSGNSLVVLVEGTSGTRWAESYNGEAAAAATLEIEFSLCGEICDNGIDDDGDGLIDGLDDDCSPCPDLNSNGGLEDSGSLSFNTTYNGIPAVVISETPELIPSWVGYYASGSGTSEFYYLNDASDQVNNPEGDKFMVIGGDGYCFQTSANMTSGNCYEIIFDAGFFTSGSTSMTADLRIDYNPLSNSGYPTGISNEPLPISSDFNNMTWTTYTVPFTPSTNDTYRIFFTLANVSGAFSGGVALDNVIIRECCPAEICGNGIDDDGDGLIDNADEDCALDPEVCYLISDGFVDGSSTMDTLYTFDHTTGTVSAVGPTGTTNIEAMALDAVNGIIYTASRDSFGTIDPITGAFNVIAANMGTVDGAEGSKNINGIDGMTYDAANGIIWASERLETGLNGLPDDYILKINPFTGLPIQDAFGAGVDYLIVATDEHDIDDLAMAADGTLYAISNYGGSGNQMLGTINKTTGIFTPIGDYGVEDVESLAFTSIGQMIATTGEDGNHKNRLYTIDAGTAKASFIGSILPAHDVEACECLHGSFINLQIGDIVWADINGDGIQDIDEPGVENVSVNLLDENGAPILDGMGNPRTTTTDVYGVYNFDRLSPGNYMVEFVLPSGTSFSPQNIGGDDALDSDANTSSGRTSVITLSGSTNNYDTDAGLQGITVTVRDCSNAGELFVADNTTGIIYRYDENTGALIDEFITGLVEPRYMAVGPDELLYVSEHRSYKIKVLSLVTGKLIRTIESSKIGGISGLLFGPDDKLYINDSWSDNVHRYDPILDTLGTFIQEDAGGLDSPRMGAEFGPDGNFYVVSKNSDQVLKFNGITGAFIDTFVMASNDYVNAPWDLTFGPDGNLYVTSAYSDQVVRFNASTGAFIDNFVTYQSGGIDYPTGLAFGADGHLYVTAQNAATEVYKYDGTTGDFIEVFTTGLTEPTGMLFAPVPGCTEICDNGIDDDGDGDIDEADADCFSCSNGLLANPDFESGFTNWWTNGEPVITTDARFGNNAVYASGAAQNNFSQSLPASVGETYTLSVYAKKTTGAMNASVRVNFYDASWTVLSSDYLNLTASDWQEYVITATAPANTAWVVPGGWADVGVEAVFDGFCLTREELCANGIDDDGDGLIDSIDPDCPQIENCSCTGTNLFDNPSFESGTFNGSTTFIPGVFSDDLGSNWGTPSGLDGWSHGPLHWVESPQSSDGSRMIYINNPSSGPVCTGQYYDIGTGVGQISTCATYQVCFEWASFNRENPDGRSTTSQPAIDFTWFDENGSYIDATHQALGTPVANQDFDHLIWSSISYQFSLTGSFAPPANAARVRVNISEHGAGQNKGILFDNTSLCEVSSCGSGICENNTSQTPLWLVDEDEAGPDHLHLWAFTDYDNATSTGIDYGRISYFDPSTSTVRDIGDAKDLEAMAVNKYTGQAYFFSRSDANNGPGSSMALWTYNLNDAEADKGNIVFDLLGHIFRPSNEAMEGLVFDPNTNRLYTADPVDTDGNSSTVTDILYYIDITALNADPLQHTNPIMVGPITGMGETNNYVDGMEFDESGKLYTIDGTDEHLYEINPATGAIIDIVDNNLQGGTGHSSVDMETIAWDNVNSRLIAVDNDSDHQEFVEITLGTNGGNIVRSSFSGTPGLPSDADFEASAMFDACADVKTSIGNLVFLDANNNGDFDSGEGVDNVRVQLFQAGANAQTAIPAGSTVTSGGGFYIFENLEPGNYFVHVPAANFANGAPLENTLSLSGNGTDTGTDDDSDENGIDNSSPATNGISSGVIALQVGTEPTNGTTETGQNNSMDDSDDNDGDMTVDFGFGMAEICDDGIDNDGDGLTDGDDPDCSLECGPTTYANLLTFIADSPAGNAAQIANWKNYLPGLIDYSQDFESYAIGADVENTDIGGLEFRMRNLDSGPITVQSDAGGTTFDDGKGARLLNGDRLRLLANQGELTYIGFYVYNLGAGASMKLVFDDGPDVTIALDPTGTGCTGCGEFIGLIAPDGDYFDRIEITPTGSADWGIDGLQWGNFSRTCGDCPMLVHWDMENCDVGGLDDPGFAPHINNETCASLTVTNMQTTNSTGNSCGSSSSSIGENMCFGGQSDSGWNDNDPDGLQWELSYGNGETGTLERMFLRQQSRVNCPGTSNPSNTPQFYGLRVLKDGVEIFKSLDNPAPAGTWQNDEIDFTGVPEFAFTGPVTFKFELLAYAPANNGGNCEIWEVDELEIYGCCGPSEICGNGIDDDGNGLIDDEDPACFSCPGGILVNPDFEDDLTGWTSGSNGSITSDAYFGSKAARQSGNGGGFSQSFAVTAGKNYAIEYYAKKSGPEDASLGITFYDAGGNGSNTTYITTTSTDYEKYFISLQAPENAVSATFLLWKSAGSGTATWDAFCVTEYELPPPSCTGCELTVNEGDMVWLTDYTGVGNNHVGYIPGELALCDNGDGTYDIKGTIFKSGDANTGNSSVCGARDDWELQLTIFDKQSWSEFGGSFVESGSCPNHEDWDYWDVSGILVGLGCNTGDTIYVTGPSPGYRLQIGSGANSLGCEFGMSTWFSGTDEDGNPLAMDIYALLDSVCYTPPEICTDGIDNDGDGLADCADPDCDRIDLSNINVSNCIDHPLQDVVTVSVDVSWTYAPANDTIIVEINRQKEYINVAGGVTSPQTISFTFPADGSTGNTITAYWKVNNSLCEETTTFDAPIACSNDRITCDILYLCGLDKPYDGDAWDHGWIEYLDEVNGSATVTPILTKNEAGMGTYDPMNPSNFVNVNLSNYGLIIVSATTEGHISTDLVVALKDVSGALLNSNYRLVNDFGMAASEATTSWQSHAYVDDSNSKTIYNFNNDISPWSGRLMTKANYLNNADSYLWQGAGDQLSGSDGIYFVYEAADALPGVPSSHGRRVFLGYHFNGFYANDENGGAVPAPVDGWFSPAQHLTLDGKFYFDQALIEAAVGCNIEVCNNGQDDDGDGLTDCADPDCEIPAINSVAANHPDNCPQLDDGEITVNGTGSNLEYSIDGGNTYQPSNIFTGLTPGSYNVRIRIVGSSCYVDYANNPVVLNDQVCGEICDNGIDDDGDGLIDCADDDCSPTVYAGTNVNICVGSTYTISASASGGEEPYVYNWNIGPGQSHNVSPPLGTTTYYVTVTDNNGCTDTDQMDVIVTNCAEECADGIDNDGDGLIDCDDPDCLAYGQPRPVYDSYVTCPGVDFVEQVIFNDDNLQSPTYSIYSNPSFGSVNINSEGIFTYSPYSTTCGNDAFIYEVCNQTTGCCDTASVFIKTGDTDPPTLQNIPADITISCDEIIPEIPLLVYGEDVCPGIYISFDEESNQPNPGACQTYEIYRTWTATDLCGNSTSDGQTITVVDDEAPEIFRVYTLGNGKKIMGGISNRTSDKWKYVEFPINFENIPVVIAQVNTENENTAVNCRIRNVSIEGFELRLQEEESQDGLHDMEEVSWVAVERGGVSDASNLQVDKVENVNSNSSILSYANTFDGQPSFIAALQTYNDSDPVSVRYSNTSPSSINLYLEEETSADTEVSHGNEDLGYLAMEPGVLLDEENDFIGESGSLSLDENWETVPLSREFTKPVVVFGGILSGTDPATIRVRNVTSNSFEVRIEEWEIYDDNLSNRTVSYFVMEGSIPSASAHYCAADATVLEPGINLFAVDNCDAQLDFIYEETSELSAEGNRISRSWTCEDDCGNAVDISRTDTCVLAAVRVRARLGGALINAGGGQGLMRDNLRTLGYIPLEEPYTELSGFHHKGDGGGELTTQAILDVTGDDAIVDWVFVEIRNRDDAEEVVSTCSALLQRDGDVVRADGEPIIFFPSLQENDYFVTIRHRNHLGLMTNTVNYLSTNAIPDIDFDALETDVEGQYEAGNELMGSFRACWAGDLNSDGRVIYQGPLNDIFTLFSRVLSAPGNTDYLANYIRHGYQAEDLDMNGKAIYQGPGNDRALLLYNTVLVHPNNGNFLGNFIVSQSLP